jgi:hypothetical protein
LEAARSARSLKRARRLPNFDFGFEFYAHAFGDAAADDVDQL